MGKKVTFTQDNFKLITGLWLTEERLEMDTSSERLRDLILRTNVGSKLILCKDVETVFENKRFVNHENAVKVALVLYIEMVMMGKDKKTQFDLKTLGIVDDIKIFRCYD